MEYLRTEEWGLPEVLNRDLPEDCQYLCSKDIYRGYRCKVCGKVFTDVADACHSPEEWEEVEVDINGELIKEEE